MLRAKSKHEFNSALIGMIMGDSNIPLSGNYMYIRHGIKQFEYVDNKVDYLLPYLKPTSIKESVDKKGYAYKYAYYNDEKLKYMKKYFYKNGKKVLSKNILNRINNISLAFFYMDDGCLSLGKDKRGCINRRNIYLATNSFTVPEIEAFQEILLNKFDIKSYKNLNNGTYRLRLNTENTIKFLKIVAPIVINFPVMHYKLDLKYKTKNISFLNNKLP